MTKSLLVTFVLVNRTCSVERPADGLDGAANDLVRDPVGIDGEARAHGVVDVLYRDLACLLVHLDVGDRRCCAMAIGL